MLSLVTMMQQSKTMNFNSATKIECLMEVQLYFMVTNTSTTSAIVECEYVDPTFSRSSIDDGFGFRMRDEKNVRKNSMFAVSMLKI